LGQKAPRSLSKNKSKQLVFDKQLKCYFDPVSNEYFEMVPKIKNDEKCDTFDILKFSSKFEVFKFCGDKKNSA
jgi:hypothetical protein